MRFLIVRTKKDFCQEIIQNFLKPQNYKEINGQTGGDDDFVCIDTLNKEWCWCEYGFAPFDSHKMDDYQFDYDKDLKLEYLVNIRS